MGRPDLQEALRWAAEKHFGQWREGEAPLPYLCHPVDVLCTVRTVGGVTDDAILCAAALHDVVEETDGTSQEVHAKFGGKVGKLVDELTRYEPGPEETAGMSKDEIWTLRARYLLDEIAAMSPEAQIVKLADRIANLRDARDTKKGKKLARYVVQSRRILEIVPKAVNKPLWEALKSEITKKEAL